MVMMASQSCHRTIGPGLRKWLRMFFRRGLSSFGVCLHFTGLYFTGLTLSSVVDYAREHGEASLPQALDWELVTKDEAFIPPVWRNHGIRDPNEIEFFNMAVIYHRLYEAQNGPAPFRWHLPTIPVRELSMASTAVPATPRRNTRVVFSSPVKGTPCRPRLQDSPIRAMRCDLVSIESTDVDGSKSDSENVSAPLPALNVPTPLTQTAIVSTTPGTLTASAAPTAPTAPATGTTELLVNTPRSPDHACALNHVNASLHDVFINHDSGSLLQSRD